MRDLEKENGIFNYKPEKESALEFENTLKIFFAIICLGSALNNQAFSEAAALAGSLKGDGSRPNVYLYDMGSTNSPLWTGFRRITPETVYGDERGYGWVLSRQNKPCAYLALDLDALAADYVSDTANITLDFRQDLPNGEYEVWVLTGSHLSLDYLLHPHSLRLQDRDVINIQPHDGDVFRPVKYEWSKGDDMYEQFIAPRFKWLHHKAIVSDGKLIIGFANAKFFPVCALVIAGQGAAEYADEEIRNIEQLRKKAFYNTWEAAPVKLGDYEPASSVEERAREYIVSAVNYLDEVLPGSAPPVGASRSRIEIFATPGEQEQASFAVYALTNLRQVSFDLTDLRAADGKVIPASAIHRGLVQFAPRHLTDQPPKYDIYPTMILPVRPTFVGKDTCKQFWMTVSVPGDAAAGTYEGELRISSLDAAPAALKLRLRVLPFKLMVPPVERFFYFGGLGGLRFQMAPWEGKEYWDSVRAETRFLKENEFCIAQFEPGDAKLKRDNNGRVVDVDLSSGAKLLEIVKEENAWPRDNAIVCRDFGNYFGGYWREGDGPGEKKGIKFAPTPEDRADCIRTVQIINEKARKAGWPEIVFEVGGELSNWGKQGLEFGIAVHSALKEAGVRNALRGNGAEDIEVIAKGLVDYPVPACYLMTEKWFPVVKANAKRLWAYGFTEGRFGYGWFCFKHGIMRAGSELGIDYARQPGNIFDDRRMIFPFGGLPISLTSLVPSVPLKRMVEGADDLKYLYTLDGLIKKAEASGKPSAQAAGRTAKAWLDERLKTIPEYVDKALEGGGDIRMYKVVDKIVNWSPGDYDKYRWQMAEFIMTLQKELGE